VQTEFAYVCALIRPTLPSGALLALLGGILGGGRIFFFFSTGRRRGLHDQDVMLVRTLRAVVGVPSGMLSTVVELKSCFHPDCWKPCSKRLAARTLRFWDRSAHRS
jgi:hypothetical protein